MPLLSNDDTSSSLVNLLNNTKASGAAADLDVIEFLNENFSTVESLDNIDTTILELNKQIGSIDDQLKEVIRDQAYSSETARLQLDTINERSMQLVERISNVKDTASSSESMVKTGCTEIRKLDTAKRNITFSITSLKRLIMLSKYPILLSFDTLPLCVLYLQFRELSSSLWHVWTRDTRRQRT